MFWPVFASFTEHQGRRWYYVTVPERWTRWVNTLLNTTSPTLDSRVVNRVEIWLTCVSLNATPSMIAVEQAIRGMASSRSVGPDGLPSDFMRLFPDGEQVLFSTVFTPSSRTLGSQSGTAPQPLGTHRPHTSLRRTTGWECGNYQGNYLVAHNGKVLHKHRSSPDSAIATNVRAFFRRHEWSPTKVSPSA